MQGLSQEIHARMQGKWRPFVETFIDAELLDGRGHPCPWCNGTDRFNTFDDFDQTGGVNCRVCHNTNNSDGIATYAKAKGLSQGNAIKEIAQHLGIGNEEHAPELDIIQAVCVDKRMPINAFLQFKPEQVKQGRGRRIVARLNVYNEKLEACGTFDLWPGDKGRFGKGSEHGLFLQHDVNGNPVRIVPGETVLIVEGVKDAAALVGLGYEKVVGLPTSFLASKFYPLFKDVHAVIVPDLDEVAEAGSHKTGGHLRGVAASIKVARLPGEIRATKGDDVRDILRKPQGASLVRFAIENALDWEPREGEHDARDGCPDIFVTLNEAMVRRQVIVALSKLGWSTPWVKPKSENERSRVYQRGGMLYGVYESEDPSVPSGTLQTRPLPPPIVRERITQACQLVQERETEDDVEVVRIPPPRWLIEAVSLQGNFDGQINPLTGIIQSPTIRSDGSILQNPGYDLQTGIIYEPLTAFPTIPEKPTLSDARAAAAKLLDVISDFPTSTQEDRTAWLAMVLTMVARQCINGCVPMFVFNANTRGAGKSLLVDAGSIIAYGRSAARRIFTRDDNEQRKMITATAIEMTPLVLLDNVDIQLGGGPLDAAMTSRTWSDRILGATKTTGDLPLRTIWAATGNNLAYGSDSARRVLPCNLMTHAECPENRTDFRHPNLLGYVTENRPALAVAALTMIRAYFVAGQPRQDSASWGSFEEWTDIIRGAIVWAGLPDPLKTRQSALASDDSRELLGALITGFLELQSIAVKGRFTTKDIERLIAQDNSPAMSEAVTLICGSKFDGRRFSSRLRSYVGRNWQGYSIHQDNVHGGVKAYSAIQLDLSGGCGGSGGTFQPNYARKCDVSHDTYTDTCDTSHAERPYGWKEQPKPPQPPVSPWEGGSEVLI